MLNKRDAANPAITLWLILEDLSGMAELGARLMVKVIENNEIAQG
jgi:hypothetical protein